MENNDRTQLDFSSLWIGYLNDSYPNLMFANDSSEEFNPGSYNEVESSK